MNDPSSPAPPDIEPDEEPAFHYRVSWRCDDSPGIHWRLAWLTVDGAFLADFGLNSPDPMKCVATSVRDTIAPPRWRACREILRELESGGELARGDAFAVLSKVTSDEHVEKLFRYRLGDEKRSERAALFMQLVDAIENRLSGHYRRLDYIHLLCACAEEMTRAGDHKPDREDRELIPRVEARVPAFSREQFEVVIAVCRKTLAALSVPPEKPIPVTLKAKQGPEPIGMTELVDACARNWEQVVAVLASKERPTA